jgi:hypothetical protein
MAKRRNLKKEKAQRNLAYARKFRKRKSNNRMTKTRRPASPSQGAEEESEEAAAT